MRVAQRQAKSQKNDHYLVGIGASAGGLEAIHQLFDHFPPNTNFSFVIIQHLSPDHKSLMAELLSKHTAMKVYEAQDGMLTQANCVYVLPAKKQLTIRHSRLVLADKVREKAPNFAIDLFFESLAQDRKTQAIALILSGTGTDGTKGIELIKEAGGMVIVQDPSSAKFDGMPQSAISSGHVDFVLSPSLMPQEIITYTQRVPLLESLIGTELQEDEEPVLQEIVSMICHHSAYDFKDYKQATLKRRIYKRMGQQGFTNSREYLQFMRETPSEVKQLCQTFFIGVTSFFRDGQAFEFIEKEILPAMAEKKKTEELLKIWVVACSTGEEAYSLAILCREYALLHQKELNVKIFATDIDKQAIDTATKGIYPGSLAKDVSKERLERFFHQRGKKYIVSEEIRKMIVFAVHDITKDTPFSKMDMISCRNMLIYMNADLQKKILSTFTYSLQTDAYLVLGSSEHIGEVKASFSEENKKWKIYKKIKESPFQKASFISKPSTPALPAPQHAIRPSVQQPYTESFIDAFTEDFAVTGIYIDEHFQLLHGIGDMNAYMHFPKKRFHYNVLKMLPQNLSTALSIGVRKALKLNEKIVVKGIKVKKDAKTCLLTLSIRPLPPDDHPARVLLVLISEEKNENIPFPSADTTLTDHGNHAAYIASLERELKETQESLHIALEDLSNSNEELQSYTEEMLSSNEELQSTNEELQSLNEELHTVNAEHQLKIKELQELNDDLDNYFRSTNIGKIFIDHQLIIRKFTPVVSEQINLIDSDVGRPISHISHNLRYSHLLEDVRYVNNTAKEIEKEVQREDGKYYLMKIIPYLRRDQTTDGVILSFVDITTLKTLHNIVSGVLNSSLNSIMAFQAIRDEHHTIIDLKLSLLNNSARQLINNQAGEPVGKSLLTLLPFVKAGNLYNKLIGVISKGEPLHTEQYIEKGLKGYYAITAVKMEDGITLTFADITARKRAEEKAVLAYEELKKAEENLLQLNKELERRVNDRTAELANSEERFRLVSVATNDVIWDWNLITNQVWWNEGIKTMLGYHSEQIEQGVNWWFEKIHPSDRSSVVKGINEAINRGKNQWSAEYQMLKEDGSYCYVFNRAYILHNEYGMPYRILGAFIDLSGLKAAEAKLKETNEHLLRINADLDTFVYTASHDLKAPISNIEGLVLMLERKLNAPEGGRGSIEQVLPLLEFIKQSVNRFKNTVRDLAEVTKVQKNIDGEQSQLDFEGVLEQVRANIGETITAASAKIHSDFSQAPVITFSKKNLYSIFYNLVSNAIKYRSPEREPEIYLKTEILNGGVRLTVQDNGLGIGEENVHKIFTLFKRFHTHVEGTGIGLYIVKRIMDNSGGTIEVTSKEGEGTMFRLYFTKNL